MWGGGTRRSVGKGNYGQDVRRINKFKKETVLDLQVVFILKSLYVLKIHNNAVTDEVILFRIFMGKRWTRWQEVGHCYLWNWGESCDGICYSSHVLLPTYMYV